MESNNKAFNPTYYLTDEQIKHYQKWSSVQIFKWLETTHEFLNKHRTRGAKAFNDKIRRGEI